MEEIFYSLVVGQYEGMYKGEPFSVRIDMELKRIEGVIIEPSAEGFRNWVEETIIPFVTRKEIGVYKIYDVDDDTLPKCELISGTLEDCVEAMEGWIADKLSTASEEEIAEYEEEEAEGAIFFINNPYEFINQNGCDEVEIYMGWTIVKICDITL